MKRQGFILTEILTSMMLQAGFAIVLCGAFYMILNFSTNAQQGFAANDKGQMVISYFDNRIRNAGLGLWGCDGSADIRIALDSIPALRDSNANKKLCLPVAVLNNTGGSDTLSRDKSGRFYRGNVLILLHAHKDTKTDRVVLLTSRDQQPKDVKYPSSSWAGTYENNKFSLIGENTTKTYNASNFNTKNNDLTNIRNYTVLERSGVPLYTKLENPNLVLQAPQNKSPVTVYPFSEMLHLECQRLYVGKDSNGYNFMFSELKDDGSGWDSSRTRYHTKDILDLYMTLDTRPNTHDKVPIFELRVLVAEGINDNGTTDKPKDWPGQWTTDFSTYKVHVSKVAWKLYNLAPLFN